MKIRLVCKLYTAFTEDVVESFQVTCMHSLARIVAALQPQFEAKNKKPAMSRLKLAQISYRLTGSWVVFSQNKIQSWLDKINLITLTQTKGKAKKYNYLGGFRVKHTVLQNIKC